MGIIVTLGTWAIIITFFAGVAVAIWNTLTR